MSNRVAIVNNGLCNLNSITRAVEECGGEPFATDAPKDLASADRIILPGVGAFAVAMRILRSKGLDQAIQEEVARRNVPLLGVCLGMQLLGESSSEGGESEGLGLLPGRVEQLVPTSGERIPHMGWNSIIRTQDSPLLTGIADGTDFYFVHSYHLKAPEAVVVARTPYCGSAVAVARHGSVFATQFHPEKSQKAGFQLLRNFLSYSC